MLGVSFLGDTAVVCSRKLTYLDSAWCSVQIALKLIGLRKPTFIDLNPVRFTSTAQVSLQGQNKLATGAFSKPAPPAPNTSRLALSMILEKKKCSVINLFEPKYWKYLQKMCVTQIETEQLCISQFQQCLCPPPPGANPRTLAFFRKNCANYPGWGRRKRVNAPPLVSSPSNTSADFY